MADHPLGTLVILLIVVVALLGSTYIGGYVGMLFSLTGGIPLGLIPLWIVLMVPILVFGFKSTESWVPSVVLGMWIVLSLIIVALQSRPPHSALIPGMAIANAVCSVVWLVITIKHMDSGDTQ